MTLQVPHETLAAHAHITSHDIRRALKLALRTGKYFKLKPEERATLTLAARVVRDHVKSFELKLILIKIFEEISEKILWKAKLFILGLSILEKRVKQAILLGYKRVLDMLKDKNYIMSLGAAYLSIPSYYKL